MSKLAFKMTAATDLGLVRTNNEDNFIVNPDLTGIEWSVPSDVDKEITLGKNGAVMIVADGMGGMNAGEVASELAVSSIRTSFQTLEDYSEVVDCSNHIEAFLKSAIVKADSVIKNRVKEDPATAGMGTTIVIAWVIENVVHVAWCGDSRAYLFNRSSGLSRLSNDHSYVQELVNAGKLDPELAFDHPNSNIITRSLGDSSVKAQPDYVCKRLAAGDYIILCSDGLCGLVRDDDILALMMQEHESIDDYKKDLFAAAFAAGGYDNITIGILECSSIEESELSATKAPGVSGRKKTNKAEDKPKKSRKWIWILLIIMLLLAAAAYLAVRKGYIHIGGIIG